MELDLKSSEKSFLNDLEKEYERTIVTHNEYQGCYFSWSNKNYTNESFSSSFDEIFTSPKEVSFRSSYWDDDKIRVEKFPHREFERNRKLRKTGYVLPHFDFIDFPLRSESKSENYSKILKQFDLDKSLEIPPEKVPVLNAYKNTLFTQIERQIEALKTINNSIKNIIKVAVFEGTKLYDQKKQSVSGKELYKLNSINQHSIEKLNQVFSNICKGASSSSVRESLNEYINFHKCFPFQNIAPDFLYESTKFGVLYHLDKKDREVIIEVSLRLILDVYALESILQDAFLNNKIKTSLEYEKQSLTKDIILQKGNELKEAGMKVENVFEKIKSWLFDELNFDNKELKTRFGFKLHEHESAHESFNKLLTNAITRTNRTK